MASIVQLSEFPIFNPSFNERVLFTAKGDFQRPHPTLLQNHVPKSQLQFRSPSLQVLLHFSFEILHFRAPRWAPLAVASSAARDQKWLTHSLGKRNW